MLPSCTASPQKEARVEKLDLGRIHTVCLVRLLGVNLEALVGAPICHLRIILECILLAKG